MILFKLREFATCDYRLRKGEWGELVNRVQSCCSVFYSVPLLLFVGEAYS